LQEYNGSGPTYLCITDDLKDLNPFALFYTEPNQPILYVTSPSPACPYEICNFTLIFPSDGVNSVCLKTTLFGKNNIF
jgi:hypothetical protein